MKTISTLFFLLSCILTQAQSNYTPATLTRQDNTNERVYFKHKTLAINNKGELNIYTNTKSNSKLVLNPIEFSKIVTENGEIEITSTTVKGINNNNKVILRKLVDGKNSLYEYKSIDNSKLYVTEKDGKYKLLNLTKIKGSNDMSYKEWLYKVFNPNQKPINDYQNISYNSSDLTDYFIENNVDARKLTQEKKVDFIKLGLQGGYVYNSFTPQLESLGSNGISTSSYRFGIRSSFNINRIQNRLSFIVGFNYFTSIDGDENTIINPSSIFNRRDATTTLNISYWSFNIGAQYNIPIKSFDISPYISFEPLSLSSSSGVTLIDETNETTILDAQVLRSGTTSFNFGLKITKSAKYYMLLEYSTVTGLEVSDSAARISSGGNFLIDNNRISLVLGYNIF